MIHGVIIIQPHTSTSTIYAQQTHTILFFLLIARLITTRPIISDHLSLEQLAVDESQDVARCETTNDTT